MAVNYVIKTNRFKTGAGAGAKYIKCVSNYIVDTKDMARRISSQCTLTEADIQAVLQAYETNLKMMFAQGNSVRIFNLGTLKPCFKADFDSKGNVVKDSVRLSKVQLITNHTFLNDAKGYEYRCHGEADDYCPDYEGRVQNMMEYFNRGFDEITAREYVYINDCSKTQACDDLRQLYKEGVLKRRSYGNTMVYRLNNDNMGSEENIKSDVDRDVADVKQMSENQIEGVFPVSVERSVCEDVNKEVVIEDDMNYKQSDDIVDNLSNNIDICDKDKYAYEYMCAEVEAVKQNVGGELMLPQDDSGRIKETESDCGVFLTG